VEWLSRIDEHAGGKFALIVWNAGEIRGERLLAL
jgi:arsenite-transporting ATPase